MSIDPVSLAITSTLISTVGGLAMGSYQNRVAQNEAILAQQAAQDAREAGQIQQQEQDFAALQQMSAEEGRMAASGFSLNSQAFSRRRQLNKILARRDALRIRTEAERTGQSFDNRAAAAKAEGKAARFGNFLTVAQGGLEIGDTLISSATRVNRKKAEEINRG